jgi:putative ubiquitin-RnfH superfamily antitoxin RatB of RatAB toxin-antitoxin module
LQEQGIDGLALHGVRCDAGTRLNEGDRIELLRPLVADPKDARRVRASRAGTRKAP